MTGPADWREDSFCMKKLIRKLYDRQEEKSSNFSDLTFRLPDGSQVMAHRLILAVASPYFEAQFFGLLSSDETGPVDVKNVDSNSFRKLLEFIYKSGEIDWSLDMENMEYWNLLQAAHMYLVPGLITLCNKKLSTVLNTIVDNRELVEHVNRASQLYIYEGILSAGLVEIKSRLGTIIKSEIWNYIAENVVLDILDDDNIKATEGELFEGIIRWCNHNSADKATAVKTFQAKFASKIKVKNMTKDTFLQTIGDSDFISPDLFKAWTFEIMKCDGVKIDATRFALHPLKIQQTVIERQDFLEQRMFAGPVGPLHEQEPADTELWRVMDEYDDVNIFIRIFQKVTDSGGARAKFGILLETVHKAKANMNKPAIKERVSVKMVAKKQDGTVVKKLFKPIEDSNKEGASHKSNIFVLSKNKEERQQWHVMEIVVIIDRRPTCHIKGISGEEFAKTVCIGQTKSYLNKAVSMYFDVNLSIKSTVEQIAERLGVTEVATNHSQWLYIFTKGYVSNLRSRRAMPNDYWTAETVEDYMRCKVINFPIGVQNEAMRRDAFRTWIISRKVSDEKEKDKKNVFVCIYNPDIQEVKFLKTLSLPVETKVETLGLLEHISLGSVKVDEKFFHDVTFGVPVTLGVKIFIRRIFPIQNENDEKMQRVLVTEAVLGTTLTHIDDCHVLVVQTKKTYPDSLDFDQFLLLKIREVEVRCINRDQPNHTLKLCLDPNFTKSEIVGRLAHVLQKPRNRIQIFRYHPDEAKSNIVDEPLLRDDESFSTIFHHCEGEDRVLYFQESSGSSDPFLEAGPSGAQQQDEEPGFPLPHQRFASAELSQPLEENAQKEDKWLDDMDTA